MRVVLERDGRKEEVDVAADLSSVTVRDRRYPVTVVTKLANRVELEVDGEKVVVENWPEHFPTPFGPVDVNGERWTVRVETSPGDVAAAPPPESRSPVGPTGDRSTAATPVASSDTTAADGVPVVPAMPGRVIEVRVANGDRVSKGQTLLVLEAMKMRGEVASPADGIVRYLRVAPGSNARAKEPMMRIVPDPTNG